MLIKILLLRKCHYNKSKVPTSLSNKEQANVLGSKPSSVSLNFQKYFSKPNTDINTFNTNLSKTKWNGSH